MKTKDEIKAEAAAKVESVDNMAGGGAEVAAFKSLRFPKDLGTDNVPAYIRFVPKQATYGGTEGLKAAPPAANAAEENTSTNKSDKDYKRGIKNLIKSKIRKEVKGLESSLKNKVASSFGSSDGGSFLGSIISGKINIGKAEITIGAKTRPDQLDAKGSISLFLPETLQAQTNASYSAQDAGNLGMQMAKGMTDGASVADAGALVEAGLLDGMKSLVSNVESLKSGIALSKGLVANNYSFQIFDGVEHRSFSYTFPLVAKNEKESLEIKEIVDVFLYYMLPEKDAGNDIGFFRIPAMWEVGYYYQGKRMEYHQQPNGHMFLTSVDVSYGGEAGNNLYTNGAPMSVELTLNFVELEPLYRDKGV